MNSYEIIWISLPDVHDTGMKLIWIRYRNNTVRLLHGPLARRKAPAEGRRPEGEGANLDQHLVPYHGKQGESNLASSLFIYMHQPRSSCAASEFWPW